MIWMFRYKDEMKYFHMANLDKLINEPASVIKKFRESTIGVYI